LEYLPPEKPSAAVLAALAQKLAAFCSEKQKRQSSIRTHDKEMPLYEK
jgi:hypothetical protein